MTRPRVRSALLVLCTIVISGHYGSPARALAPQYPNLVPLPPIGVTVSLADDHSGPALRFAFAAANKGEHALDLVGTPEGAGSATAHQCVAWAAPRICSQRQAVGRFVWHPDHGHNHFEDFALYELRTLRADGTPDMRPRGLAASGGKISFCLIDYEQDADDADPYPYPLYYSCAVGGAQGISPGWRDVYESDLTGQQIVLGGVAPGTYALMVTADPDGRLFETDETDNVAAARLRLVLQGGRLRATSLCRYDAALRSCN